MGVADNQAAKVTAFVQPQLEAGEQIDAVLGQAMKGASTWSVALISPLLSFMQKPFAVVVTDRRVLLVELKMALTGYPPKAIAGSWPRTGVKASFNHGPLSGNLTLEAPSAAPLKLGVQSVFLKSGDAVVAALNPAFVAPTA